jgi:AcrR family transcriptional regulator
MNKTALPRDIILQCISLSSGRKANAFSLAEIADSLGLKESDILALFPNKESLIQATCRYIEDDFYVIAVNCSKNGTNFADTINLLIDHFVHESLATRFLLNYDDVFPRKKMPEDFQDYKAHFIECFVKPLDAIKPAKGDTELGYQITDHWTREVILYCQMVIDHAVVDSPKLRQLLIQIIEDGLFSFPKIAGTPGF